MYVLYLIGFFFSLLQVHLLRSVDNLFVVVAEYDHYQFKESKVSMTRLSSLYVKCILFIISITMTNGLYRRRR